jgi:hypothetical protein
MAERIRKNYVPKGASLNRLEDERLEELAINMANTVPTKAWPDARPLWWNLPKAHPSTRRRIISHLFKVCSNRGEVAPLILAIWVGRELGTTKQPRSRIRNMDNLIKAAVYHARHDGASREKIAAGIGLPEPCKKRETIAGFQRTRQYKQRYEDERFLLMLETKRVARLTCQEESMFTINGEPAELELPFSE